MEVSLLRLLAFILIGVVVAVAAVGVVFVVGMRRGNPTVRRLLRGFARSMVNPRVLRSAGTPGAAVSVIRHVGRTSGRTYRTPVSAEPAGDGFVIALPYGTTSNWVRNVLASGSATIVRDGVFHRVDQPRIVPINEVSDLFPAKDLRGLRRFRVEHCMRLSVAPEPAPATPAVTREVSRR